MCLCVHVCVCLPSFRSFACLPIFDSNLCLGVCRGHRIAVFMSQSYKMELHCHFISRFSVTLSPSDPFNGGVQQEFVSASRAAGGDSAGVPGRGGAHLHPVLCGVEALRRLLQRRDAAVHTNSHL